MPKLAEIHEMSDPHLGDLSVQIHEHFNDCNRMNPE